MDGSIEGFQQYLGLDEEVVAIMGTLAPAVIGQIPRVSEAFYLRLEQIPAALSVFRGGREQLVRQRIALSGWLAQLFQPPYDADYWRRRRKVGIVHLNSGVDEHLMIASMNWLRQSLSPIVEEVAPQVGLDPKRARTAVDTVLDFDLGLILGSYWQDLRLRTLRVDRLALIGQFTAAINHELRNPLGVINTSAYLLRQKLGEAAPQPVQRHIEKIEKSVQRANAIVSGLLRLMRIQAPVRHQVPLDEFVRDIVSEIRCPQNIEIAVLPGALKSKGSFDRDQVRQVLENLLNNSVEAMVDQGRVELAFDADDFATSISIRDTGPGISPELVERIFDPLFSTKSFGTGLGLTLSRAIVEAHGGELVVHTGQGGTTFEIRIPHHLNPRPISGSNDPQSA
ncbi:MAG: HAMP domain-containing histidine kinase [Planctomycetes bacterium]|nr:HAMP domain-containing histidine kinase [Planctomycetota bacterium]